MNITDFTVDFHFKTKLLSQMKLDQTLRYIFIYYTHSYCFYYFKNLWY